MSISKEIELRFCSDVGLVDLLQEFSDSVSKAAGFDADGQYWIGLAVREAVTNAILHGNKEDRSKVVELAFGICEDRLRIVVRDQGKGIDESKIPDPLDPKNLLKAGGRGIFFVRSFMDSVKFRSRPEGGQELIMEKLRSQKNQGEQE
ncbi:MAG: ATP-binding protein [Acidobacteriota bacterium]|nr:MAG: ATP-binding protein [Acidobacteriota bacterium]